ncbi:MAG: isochorismatase family protein [Xanthobacteraceae bacterium]
MLVDMQQERVVSSRVLAIPDAIDAIANCRAALAHARTAGFPVAFVRWVSGSPFSSATSRSAWIEGFEPKRMDMVFDRNRPSCYASSAFAEVMRNNTGDLVLAGFAGEAACLATALDAFHRGHEFTFLADASMSHALDEIPAREVHRTVTKIIGSYGDVVKTRTWIAASSYGRSRGKRNESEHGRTAR